MCITDANFGGMKDLSQLEFDDDDEEAKDPFADITMDHAKNMRAIRDSVHRAASISGSLAQIMAPKDNESDGMSFGGGEDEFESYDKDRLATSKNAKPKINTEENERIVYKNDEEAVEYKKSPLRTRRRSNASVDWPLNTEEKIVPKHEDFPPI